MRLEGKNAIVTGSSVGIGAAIAKRYRQRRRAGGDQLQEQ